MGLQDCEKLVFIVIGLMALLHLRVADIICDGINNKPSRILNYLPVSDTFEDLSSNNVCFPTLLATLIQTGNFYIDSLVDQFFIPTKDSNPSGFSSTNPMLSSVLSNISDLSGFNFPIKENIKIGYIWSFYPEQIHLSWTENNGEMRVTWVTYEDLDSKLVFREIMCENSDLSETWKYAKVSSTLFNEGDEEMRVQYFHTAVLKTIKSQCFYEYFIGNSFFWTEIFTFSGRTPFNSTQINDADLLSPVEMVVVGDWGSGILGTYTRNLILTEMLNKRLDAVLHVGDMGYDLDERQGKIGDDWMNLIQPISAKLPYMVLPGNHESHQNMSHYIGRFKMPLNERNRGTGLFYSFNLGPAHFIMMNTEQYFYPALNETIENTKAWLIEDLEQARLNRAKIPWVLFFTHRAFYCAVKNRECTEQADLLKKEFEDLLFEYKVDIVFQGHVHNYERYVPLYKEKAVIGENDTLDYYFNPKAPIYIINGNGGNYWKHNDHIEIDELSNCIVGNEDFGYGRLAILNKTAIYYEQLSSETSKIIDFFHLVKE